MDETSLIWRGGKQYREFRRPDGSYARVPVKGRHVGPRKPQQVVRNHNRR